ncbi:MAG: N-6 DNA methylase [Promethearchaeota archaeon]
MKDRLDEYTNINFEELNSNTLKKIYLEQLNESDRRKLGQVFTPQYIIRFILHNIPLLEEIKNITRSFNLRILDPACGLGRFLLEIYDFLKRKLLDSKWDEQSIHETLLKRWLFGIDIEPIAVDFTLQALSLKNKKYPLDKLLIKNFNILESGEEYLKYFDVVIGNPPYFLISLSGQGSVRGKQYHTTYIPQSLIERYKIKYKSWPKNNQDPNIFYLFIERCVHLLRDGGYLGFIIPDILLSGNSTENLRKFILDTCCIKKIILIEGQVFVERGISNIILILQRCFKTDLREKNQVSVIKTSTFELIESDKEGKYDQFDEPPHYTPQTIFFATPQNNFAIGITKENSKIFQNIFRKIEMKKLIKLGDILEIQRGIENLKKEDALDSNEIQKKTFRKLIAATNIEKYRIDWNAPLFPCKFVDYDPQNQVYKHIIFKKNKWFAQPKIVLKRVSDKLIAALDIGPKDESDYFYTMDSVQMLWLKNKVKKKYDLRVILAILNSDFMNFYYQILFSYKNLFSRVQKAFLLELPIPFEIPQQKQKEICNLIDQLIKKFDYITEKFLNQLIYYLYFTPEEFNKFQNLFQTPVTLKDIPGIGLVKYWELKRKGIKTLKNLLECDSEEIAGVIKGIGKKSIEKWKDEAKRLLKRKNLN